MLMWQQPGNPAAEAKPIESRVYYGDFREVDGVKWPFRLRRAVGGETIEETTFDRFRINARIDPRKFEAPK
jgi:predicted thioesterase